MKKRSGIILLLCFFLASCADPSTASGPTAAAIQPAVPPDTSMPTSDSASTSASPTQVAGVTDATQQASVNSNCAGEEVKKLGGSIASSYSFTNPQEVMSWFCKGAEFEDIIVALQTEDLTGEVAEDLLQMRADGLSWDEIWQAIGLYDK